MKKQLLLVLSLLLLPVFANAQTADDLSAWWHNIEAAVQTAVQKKIDRFLDSDWAKGIERFSRAYNKVSSEAGLRWKERSNPPFSIQNIPVPARGTLGRFIYDKTETALERFTENHVIVYSWLAKLHFEIELSKTPKEAVRNYAQKRAYITTSNLLEDLRSSPFD
ncbi:MAG: hypothetical protein IKL48_00600, partial [Elusimicrobiaceae bacterium]|nr:hypothetical protein [Elusimicrobiaceae bacterium]